MQTETFEVFLSSLLGKFLDSTLNQATTVCLPVFQFINSFTHYHSTLYSPLE